MLSLGLINRTFLVDICKCKKLTETVEEDFLEFNSTETEKIQSKKLKN